MSYEGLKSIKVNALMGGGKATKKHQNLENKQKNWTLLKESLHGRCINPI